MFQAEPVLWLQAFESPFLTGLLALVSELGTTPVYAALVIVLAFGVRLRPGLSVLVALLIAGILSESLKKTFALPRPSQVDERVLEPALSEPSRASGRGSAAELWSLPQPWAVEAVRGTPGISYGLPSGHVGAATSCFLALALFFRSRLVLGLALFWIPLMAVSRMYLGRHYLGDVLGGCVVGLAAVGAAAVLVKPLAAGPGPVRPRALAPLAGVSLALLLLLPGVAVLDAENVGRLAALSASLLWLVRNGIPSDSGTLWRRSARVLVVGAVFVAASAATEALQPAVGWAGERGAVLVGALVSTGATLAGGIALCGRLKLYSAV